MSNQNQYLPKGFPICIMHSPKDGVYLTQFTYPIYDIKSWFLYSKFTNTNTLLTGLYNQWKKISPSEFKNTLLNSLPEYNYDPLSLK